MALLCKECFGKYFDFIEGGFTVADYSKMDVILIRLFRKSKKTEIECIGNCNQKCEASDCKRGIINTASYKISITIEPSGSSIRF
jgi:hypothetical protein